MKTDGSLNKEHNKIVSETNKTANNGKGNKVNRDKQKEHGEKSQRREAEGT